MKSKKIGNGRWVLGDCLEVLPRLNIKFKCVAIDPPYTMTKTGNSSLKCMPKGEILDGNIPDMLTVFKLLYSVMEDQSHIYVFCNINDLFNYHKKLLETGFYFHNLLAMAKNNCTPNRWYMKSIEYVLFMKKGKAYTINDASSKDLIPVNMPIRGKGKIHPTQKPISILETFIKNSTSKGDIVLDCFGVQEQPPLHVKIQAESGFA